MVAQVRYVPDEKSFDQALSAMFLGFASLGVWIPSRTDRVGVRYHRVVLRHGESIGSLAEVG